MDLFEAALPPISSGEVPREVFPSVVWDEITEAEYRRQMTAWAERFPVAALEEVSRRWKAQSVRWGLELELLAAVFDREVKRAERVFEEADVHRLHGEWRRTYGEAFAAGLIARVERREAKRRRFA